VGLEIFDSMESTGMDRFCFKLFFKYFFQVKNYDFYKNQKNCRLFLVSESPILAAPAPDFSILAAPAQAPAPVPVPAKKCQKNL